MDTKPKRNFSILVMDGNYHVALATAAEMGLDMRAGQVLSWEFLNRGEQITGLDRAIVIVGQLAPNHAEAVRLQHALQERALNRQIYFIYLKALPHWKALERFNELQGILSQ